ncbi:restriction endonuclease subunit S [Thiocapsa sp.]|uniref:restriction endonuclease subunit S n=1 Tax=Thiocapsa sp. TaxID=2024551 RepID=UPI002BF91768|nr:restriction endonuclease subunit S [Thiocapsa sp.]HSO81162.1 restriction endonuclease subunit S [Thiocapsa sp.]
MKWPPYPQYKPSAVEWLGDVPEHWEALPLKRRHRVVNGGTPSSSEDRYWEGRINWITPEDLGRNGSKRIGGSQRTLSEEGLSNCGAQLVPADSIVLSTRAPIGHVAITERESCTNQGCRALVSVDRRVSSDYFYYSLTASRPVLQAAGKGTTFMELSAGLLGLHEVLFPPLNEQRAIADFLDRETAKIDTLVAKKRTLIERLKEKRSALISRTVTRGLPPDAARAAGLDPHPELKPSGIDWLGDVPEHWDVAQLRRRCVILDCMHRTVSFVDDGIPLASIREVHGFEVDLSNAKQTTEEEYLGLIEGGRRPRIGDIIYSRNATVGDASIVATAERFAMGQDVCLLRSEAQDPKYLLLLLRSEPLKQQVESFVVGATFRRINVGQIRTFWACWPPVEEQRAIAAFLDRETMRIDGMVAKVETAIERLKEYRTALITAAVTGKVDVRGALA